MSEPPPDLTSDYLALRREAGAVELPRDVLRVAGPDAFSFLQGQLSQDVDLPPGASAWSLLLQPQGKVVALLRVLREDDDSFLLDTDGGWGDVVVERLQRYKLRVKCDITPLQWRCVAVRGPKARELAAGGEGLAAAADWPGLPGVDLLGEAPAAPEGARRCSLDAYEAVRIEAGIPAMGRELDERTIPAEAGVVERSVSFTKGCYTGQELVARIDSRGGNVPRHLRGLVVATNVLPPPGAVVRVDDRDVGNVTSVAESLDRRAPVALAYVGRAVSPPADATLVWDGGSAPARVEDLPLVS
ncbi:MAG TPA: glycine cleavage T C-terminal barrel domain-containing protein [Acidimicrobiales bacterium]|nr:glycine cleavage T C-terminal barrel domain-containing protein [Acidimicrobiales bacterium]